MNPTKTPEPKKEVKASTVSTEKKTVTKETVAPKSTVKPTEKKTETPKDCTSCNVSCVQHSKIKTAIIMSLILVCAVQFLVMNMTSQYMNKMRQQVAEYSQQVTQQMNSSSTQITNLNQEVNQLKGELASKQVKVDKFDEIVNVVNGVR